MSRLKNFEWQMWFPGEKSWELWYQENGQVRKARELPPGELLEFDGDAHLTRVLALPVSCQAAFPFLSNAPDPGGLLETARMHIDRQGPSFDPAGIMVEPIFGDPPTTIVRIDAPVRKSPVAIECSPLPDLIVPAASVAPLKENSIAIWDELGDTVIAFERNGKTIYYDRLIGGVDAVDEVKRLQYQLSVQRLIAEPEILSIWGRRCQGLFDHHDLFAGYEKGLEPRSPNPLCSMQPSWYREKRTLLESSLRKERRSKWLAGVGGSAGVLAVGLLIVSFFQQWKINREMTLLSPRISKIKAIQKHWVEVSTAVDPRKSFLETWRHVWNLPGIGDVKISRLDISRAGIEMTGRSENAKLALEFMERATTDPALADFVWQYDPPVIDRNGSAVFTITGQR